MTREIDHVIIHCSATGPDADIGAVDIDKWHRSKGWLGCGYHYVIRRSGVLESAENGKRCRPEEKAGAHVGDCGPGWNKRSIGICLAGGVNAKSKAENNFTEAQFATLKVLVQILQKRYPGVKVMGHKDLIKMTGAPPKDCPSFSVSNWLKDNGLN